MSNIIIDVVDNTFILSGNVAAIRNNGRAQSNFKSIGAIFEDNEKIELSFDASKKGSEDKLFRNMEKLFAKFSIKHEKTARAEGFLKDITQRKQDFEEFSEKARKIRNDQHEGNDFESFTNVVASKLARNLYSLQLLSAYHLAFAQNACNFSVPGAGKTSIVYAAYAYLKSLPSEHSKYVNRMLIICPLAAFQPWEDEYKECFGKTTSIKRLVGMAKPDRANHFISSKKTEITLISYQSATHDAEHIKNYLQKHKDVMVVLDEAHKIKNPSEEAKWAMAIKSIADDAKSRVVLTGTPAPNGYEDLWNLYQFIWPHHDIIGFPLHYLANLNKPQDTAEFIKRISPFFIRIKKGHLDLPEPKYHEPTIVPMDDEQRKIYRYIEQRYITSFEREPSGGLEEKLKKAKIIRLRQCLTNPALLKKPLNEYQAEGVNIGIDDRAIMQSVNNYQSTPCKFIEAGKLINKISQSHGADGKVIVWAYFIDNIDSLAEYLQSKGIGCKTLYGATPSETEENENDENIETREKIIRDFHKDDCPYKVILANPFAVGESISLHKACHNAIYLEKDFNAANYMQSKDRIHRVGLDENDVINYYYLISEDSIDQKIHDRVLEKENRMLDIIERDEIPLLQMNMNSDDADDNDIRAIIEDYHARKSS